MVGWGIALPYSIRRSADLTPSSKYMLLTLQGSCKSWLSILWNAGHASFPHLSLKGQLALCEPTVTFAVSTLKSTVCQLKGLDLYLRHVMGVFLLVLPPRKQGSIQGNKWKTGRAEKEPSSLSLTVNDGDKRRRSEKHRLLLPKAKAELASGPHSVYLHGVSLVYGCFVVLFWNISSPNSQVL